MKKNLDIFINNKRIDTIASNDGYTQSNDFLTNSHTANLEMLTHLETEFK